jgi:hypothetical protein
MAVKSVNIKDESLSKWVDAYCRNNGISVSALLNKLLAQYRLDRKFSTLPDGDLTPEFIKRKLDR